ncbi:MAG: hypothetical protein ACKVP3_12965 [Hyphomicrobiaceae bacterium]
MKKFMIAAVLVSSLIGLASAVQAKHTDWVKTLWEEQGRNSGG